MILFSNITIEGFGSFVKPQEFKLDQPGINIIKGNNGSGKTTIFNAFYWCLYGSNLKGVTQAKLVSNKTDSSFKGTRVSVTFLVGSVTHTVYRHINYKGETEGLKGNSTLVLISNGVRNKSKDISGIQKEIDRLLGITDRVFINGILFGQRMKRFNEEKGAEKTKIFEEAVDLLWVNKLRDRCGQEVTKLEETISKINTAITLKEQKIESLKEQQLLIEKQSKQWDENHLEKLQILKESYDDLEPMKLPEAQTQPVPAYDFDEKLREFDAEKAKAKQAQEELSKKISIRSDKGGNLEAKIHYLSAPVKPGLICPTCERDLDKQAQQVLIDNYNNELKTYEQELQKLQSELNTINVEKEQFKKEKQTTDKWFTDCDRDIKTVNDERTAYTNSIQAYNQYVSECTRIKQHNSSIEATRASITERIEKLKQTPKPVFEDHTSQITGIGEEVQVLLNEINKHKENLEPLKYWISTGLTSKGLKGYLMNSALELLNVQVQKYAALLGMRIHYSIDLTQKSKPFVTEIWLGGARQEYKEFSGGEKACIDVATSFALHDIISTGVQTNILIMDEIFEGLDPTGIDTVFELIRQKSKGKSVFIITHSPRLDARNTKTIKIIKENNTSSIQQL